MDPTGQRFQHQHDGVELAPQAVFLILFLTELQLASRLAPGREAGEVLLSLWPNLDLAKLAARSCRSLVSCIGEFELEHA